MKRLSYHRFCLVSKIYLISISMISQAPNWNDGLACNDIIKFGLFQKIKDQENIIQFTLYNSLVPGGIAVESLEELKNSNFSELKPSKFLIHGWKGNSNMKMSQSIKNQYLRHKNVNIFTVNWNSIVRGSYIFILPKLQCAAIHFADFLYNLTRILGVDPTSIHLIGHSLGGQFAGMVGRKFYETYNTTVGRITALDPAAPGFLDSNSTISNHDADFVDVFHTSISFLGMPYPIGHVDFYPNGGVIMPGCSRYAMLCSHRRSWQYFSESISNPFFAFKCEETFRTEKPKFDYIKMGEDTPTNARGIYYLKTNSKAPFSLGYYYSPAAPTSADTICGLRWTLK